MKLTLIVIVVLAVVTGGFAAMLTGHSETPTPPSPPPIAQLKTANGIIANSGIGSWHSFAASELWWRPGQRPPQARATSEIHESKWIKDAKPKSILAASMQAANVR